MALPHLNAIDSVRLWLSPIFVLCSLATPVLSAENTSSSKVVFNTLVQASSNQFELKDYQFWADQCLMLSEAKSYKESLTACEKAITLNSRRQNTDLWMLRGNALFYTGQYVQSLVSYNRVLKSRPKYSLAHTYQCAALLQLEKYDDAIDTCEQALQIDGDWGDSSPGLAWYYRGIALRQTGRLETASESFKRALLLNPDDQRAIAGQCEVMAQIYPKVRELTFVRQDKDKPHLFDPLSCKLKLKETPSITVSDSKGFRLRHATTAYELELKANSNNAILWTQQGFILEQQMLYRQALKSYERAINLHPHSSALYAYRCGVLNQLKNYQKAIESCQNAFSANNLWGSRGAIHAWNQQSVALLGLGKNEDALSAANRAIAIEPGYPAALNNLAISLWRLGKYEQANENIKKAINSYKKQLQQIKSQTFDRNNLEPVSILLRNQIITLFNRGRLLQSNHNQTQTVNNHKRAIYFYGEALKSYCKYAPYKNYKPYKTMCMDSYGFKKNRRNSYEINFLNSDEVAKILVNQSSSYLHLANSKGPSIDSSIDELLKTYLKLSRQKSKNAILWNSNLFAARYNQAVVQSRLKNYLKAEKHYRTAISLLPVNADAWTGLGISLTRIAEDKQSKIPRKCDEDPGSDNFQAAISAFEQALTINPAHTLAQKKLKDLLTSPPFIPSNQDDIGCST